MSTPLILDGWTILVVDDDPHGRQIMDQLLSYFGAASFTAEDGAQGLDLARRLHPDVVIADLAMPVMDGWEMIRHLKKDPDVKAIPIIALTAYAMVGDREKALAAGCHNYLTKPIKPTTFISELVAILVEIPELAAQLNI